MRQQPISPRLLRTKEAALYLGCASSTIRKLVHNGQLPHIPGEDGSLWRFDVRDLDAYIETQKHVT